MPDPSSGLLVVDKPSGPTSFDCVQQIKRILHERRVGHCGTLDPLAQGVLVMLFGSSTKRQQEFLDMDKQYWFRAEFGRWSESGDRTGKSIENVFFPEISRGDLERVVRSFIGWQWQIPPKFSAIKFQGKRLYEWARRGVAVPLPPRRIQITAFEILSQDGAFWEGRVTCSSGTYVRSLVDDVARKLETRAMLHELVRERVGTYKREQAVTWDTLSHCSREDLLRLAV